jgi:hypothetical protein
MFPVSAQHEIREIEMISFIRVIEGTLVALVLVGFFTATAEFAPIFA